MESNIVQYTLRTNTKLLRKLQYLSKYDNRSINKELEQLIKNAVNKFETEHGKISDEMLNQLYSSN